MPTAAFAQSTGSVDFDKEIVVTGTRTQEVGGVQTPDTSKAKAVLTQEMIARQNPGQTILDTVNLVPGVSFQNNDAYGSSGGTLTIRGFDSSRISLTFDGIPLNDSGNYAIYSNQQLDPELIEQVNVNLGTTDVDSPTASAVGGTVNYRSITPDKKMGGRLSFSVGQFDFRRFFGIFQTGELTSSGTRAWVSASTAKNDNPFNNYGKVNKQQYNAKVYQPLGNNGDFIALAGHYNQNRNNFFGSLPLRWDTTQSATNPAPRVVGSGTNNRFPRTADQREYDINYPCTTDVAQNGVADVANTCGTEFDRRYNPSNTGNIRGSSRFTLAPGVVLTVDPSFQYVKANGGGTITGREGFRTIGGVQYTGFIGGQYYFGADLNGDGDKLDTCSPAGSGCSSSNFNGVTLLAPSQTRTKRVGVISGLRWDINDSNTVRLSYTYDHANHRQTGQLLGVKANGEPIDVFPVNSPLVDENGNAVQKRDRQSYAILHQIAGEYRGEFGDLTVNVGVRAPFFKRQLDQRCFTTSAGGFIDCLGDPADIAAYALANPYSYNSTTGVVTGYAPPQKRTLTYHKLLPNLGLVYDITRNLSAFASYAKGLSVPGTDNLYNSFYYPQGTTPAKPKPETTDSWDLGLRFRSTKVQAQLSGWFTKFNDRLASAYDPDLNQTVYRNLGRVNKWGLDASIAYSPIKELTLYTFGSINRSKIIDDVLNGECNATQILAANQTFGCTVLGAPIYAQTAGKRESGTPTHTFGTSVLATLGPIDLGATAKFTGKRYIFDNNDPLYRGKIGVTTQQQIFPNAAPGYWLVNLDARVNMGYFDEGLKKTYVQFNVYNLFDKFYVGGFGGGLAQSISSSINWGNPPFVQIGAPRTASVTVSVGF
ncbi:TonB-dependent receptor [Sphingomonas jaspsi]|uniref:TonB-dependent receptor n=1 Tax=Sphingomonas jaspsi TaxID=392409 RepID=UPI0004AC9A60|nr:TonB-dependent receptor [Sphingomonas jaspsi]